MGTKRSNSPGWDNDAVDVRQAGLGKQYLKLLADMQQAKADRDAAAADIEDLKASLMSIQAESGYKTVVTPDWRVTLTSGVNCTISKEKLLSLGVSVKVISKATKRTTYETVTVTPIKGGK